MRAVRRLLQFYHSYYSSRAMHRFNINNTYLNQNIYATKWW